MNIGLSQRVLYHNGRAYDALEHGWYSWLKDHTLYFIPNRTDQNFKELADRLDLFFITGGDDCMLRRYVEIKLANYMFRLRKPVIGICHGAFLLTDLFGGVVEPVKGHDTFDHVVRYFGEERLVNSHHGLCISKPHDKAIVLATDMQGNCESWIDGNLAGIVWHPERMKTPWIPDEIESLIMKAANDKSTRTK